MVLVGGQALNLWAEYFRDALSEPGPFTSKDIDFMGGRQHVARAADLLKGKSLLPEPFDPSPNSGIVQYLDVDSTARTLDFITCPFGLSEDEVRRTAIAINFDGPSVRVFVLSPWLCFKSRIANSMMLPGYDTAHAIRQLKVSIECLRAFISVQLGAKQRDGLKLIEQTYRHVFKDSNARDVDLRFPPLDPFHAIPVEHRQLPPAFLAKRYPQMCLNLESERRRRRPPRA